MSTGKSDVDEYSERRTTLKFGSSQLLVSAHEYTASNAKFAMSVEPGNSDLVNRVAIVKAKRERNEPTVPTLLGEEKKANPFLRVDCSDEIRQNIGVSSGDTSADAFAKLRKAKDNF